MNQLVQYSAVVVGSATIKEYHRHAGTPHGIAMSANYTYVTQESPKVTASYSFIGSNSEDIKRTIISNFIHYIIIEIIYMYGLIY